MMKYLFCSEVVLLLCAFIGIEIKRLLEIIFLIEVTKLRHVFGF